MEFPGVLKKKTVEIPKVSKKEMELSGRVHQKISCGISTIGFSF